METLHSGHASDSESLFARVSDRIRQLMDAREPREPGEHSTPGPIKLYYRCCTRETTLKKRSRRTGNPPSPFEYEKRAPLLD